MGEDIIGRLNRSAKLFVDRATVATVEQAMERLNGFKMHIHVDRRAATDPVHQAALLTAVNCGRRTFLGGVTVSGALDTELATAVAAGATLADAVRSLHGGLADSIPEGVPLVWLGDPDDRVVDGFAIRPTFDGWRGGVVPLGSPPLAERATVAPAGVLAGALAVAEVFAYHDGDAMAGYRSVGMSLWDQAADGDWTSAEGDGPMPDSLPSDFWMIGLGHLGQAFLWTIGLLPYGDPSRVLLFLQDVDDAGESTESTSVLTFPMDLNRPKTRTCAEWAERRGFRTRMIERRFSEDMRVAHGEPLLALCGVDNPHARSILEGAGFATIFEAGLGAGVDDFRLIRTHSFPAPVAAARVWAESDDIVPPGTSTDDLPPAYEDLKRSGQLDQCGLARLAEVAVGAPFVGMAAAAVLIAQTMRMVVDGARPAVVNIDLRALRHRSAVWREGGDIVLFATTPAAPV